MRLIPRWLVEAVRAWRPVKFVFAELDPAERVRGTAANAVIVDEQQTGPAYGPGHPEWHGRAKIPLVESGWALPGHPLFIYQQFLKYQNDPDGLPAGWKVIGWTAEGVSYLVPEVHWTDGERAAPGGVVRRQPEADGAYDAETTNRRLLTPTIGAEIADMLHRVRKAAERHARVRHDSDAALQAAVPEAKLAEWVEACGQRAAEKRLADVRRYIATDGLFSGVPVDPHIYAPLG